MASKAVRRSRVGTSRPTPANALLEQYCRYKKMVTDTFMATGGTLSHHHAIGYEHMPWMEEEVSATGLTALRALKASLDPKGILNPGKLIPEVTADALDTGFEPARPSDLSEFGAIRLRSTPAPAEMGPVN